MPTYGKTDRFKKYHASLSAEDKKRFKLAVAKFVEDLKAKGCGCRKPDRVSRGSLVLVDQPADKVTPLHSSRPSIERCGETRSWRLHAECSMGSVGVVVLGIDAEHRLEVTTPDDE